MAARRSRRVLRRRRFSKVPAVGLLSDAYAAERRKLIDSTAASFEIRPGDPWKFEVRSERPPRMPRMAENVPVADAGGAAGAGDRTRESPDTTTVNVSDARGNLYSAAPASAWFYGGVFIAGDTGVPLGNRMQAFVLARTTTRTSSAVASAPDDLTPTCPARRGDPFWPSAVRAATARDQQALSLLNIAVFGSAPQVAIEAPRFNSLHHHRSFGRRGFGDKDGRAGVLEVEDRIPQDVIEALRRLGHRVELLGPFMLEAGTTLAGVNADYGTVFGAADVRRQRFAVGW